MSERTHEKSNWSSTTPQNQDSVLKLRRFTTKDDNDEEIKKSPESFRADINSSKFSLPINPPFPNANIQRQEQNQEEKEPEEKPEINLKSDSPPTEEPEEENKSEESESQINLKPDSPPTETPEEKEENLSSNSIQTKLTVGKPGDKYEQEADATAAKVMGMSDETLQRQTEEETEDIQTQQIPTLNTSPITEKGEEEQEDIQTKGKGDRQQQTQTSSSLESRLGSSKGGGSPLPDSVRGFMEPRFGADFGNVRVHNDSSTVQMNKELGAQAFAHGNDIYYGAGKSPGNNELTAHELTHTIQQTGGKLQRKANKLRLKSNIGTSNKIKPFERLGSKEADSYSKFEPENELQNREQTEEQTKGKQKLKSNQVKKSKKNKASTPKAVPGEQNQKTQELKSQTPEAGKTEDINSQKDAQGKQEQTKDKAVNGENPQNPPAQQPAAKPLLEQKGLDKEMTGNAAPATKAQATPRSGSGGGGSQVAGGGSGGDVGGEVNEEAEAKAMEQCMAEAETPENSDSEQLSSPEKEIAVAAIAEDPVPGEPPSGGVGGEAISEQPQSQAPDVSQSEPSAALAAISHLPPTKLLSAIGGVSGAVITTIGKQKEALVANPPSLETPSGAKSPASKVAKSVPEDKPKAVEKKPDGVAKPVPQPEPLPPQKSSPQVKTPPPAVQGNEKGELSESDVERMQASIGKMPVKDPGAMEISAGNPPELELTGNANPQKAQEQKAELEKSLAETQTKGQQSLAQPMGEDAIMHSVPQQTLKAQIAGGAGDSGGGGGETDMGDTISILAQQEKGDEIQAAAAKAQGEFAARKQEHSARVVEEKAQSHQYIEQLKLKNAEQQAQEKGKAKAEVQQMRGEWRKEQQTLVKESGTEANKLVNEGIKEIDTKKAEGEAEAQKEIHKGEQNAEQERKKGETEAAAERQKGERDSGGLFGWLASKAKAFFDGIKQGIQKAFEAARAAMRQAIELAKSMAAKAIEKCRQAIVATIQRVGNALIAIGDKLLAQWPGLQKKWRDSIQKRVEQAEATVNKLAQDLNQGIQKGLDLLGKGLDAALGLMEKGMLAAVSVYEGAVMGAIKFGEGAAKALGAFAVLAKDIGANPGQWIGNLDTAVSDGIKNHLWNAFQQQVQVWFNQKLEAVLGLGTTVWKILTQGGISMAEMGKMAWTGVKQALPMIIIGVLLERLVSMIVPAAGAVLAVIQGLQAAWGTVSQIIQAFGQFMTFLKAVKTGNAGPQFGAVLASAAIVLLEFITNFIIVKIAKAARKVAGKLKGLAKSLMKRGKGKKRKDNKDKKKKNEDDDETLTQKKKRLNRAIASMRPKLEKLLKKGVTKGKLNRTLKSLKRRYKLTSLSLRSNGEIYARINPGDPVIDTNKLTLEKLGRCLEPILQKAEQEYLQEHVFQKPEAQKRIQNAEARILNGERASPLDRDEQRALLRKIQQNKKIPQTLKMERNVDVDIKDPNNLGTYFVESPQRKHYKQELLAKSISQYNEVAKDKNLKAELDNNKVSKNRLLKHYFDKHGIISNPKFIQLGAAYPQLLGSLKRMSREYGISHAEIAKLLGKPNSKQILKRLAEIRKPLPIERKGNFSFHAENISTTAYLTQVLEPERRAGSGIANALGVSYVASGQGELDDILGRGGKWAPMTPKGASSSEKESKQAMEANTKWYRRIARIFKHLHENAKQANVLILQSGYDLHDLQHAFSTWLDVKVESKSPDALLQTEQLLIAQLKKMLANYFGK
ncbi:hypothetical protein NIES267_10140 [Calothrix parasitica NIES-267]|uniref:eCIS core domain-containing protein n=1 Tax=Calothrix parasitica NIES-267 TaxID=1973488 RepID=A0A1Z4LJX3_9CYAN|nr:hypothetical protein NIES267_10140 [Calothrix parasitica NIES-267]